MKCPKDFDTHFPESHKMDPTSRLRDSKPRQFHFSISGTFRSKSKTIIMSTKKIVSNLAEYKNGQLTCILCKVPVKNELCWTGHVSGRVHRNNIQLLKRKAQPDNPPGASAPPETKKIKTDDHHHEFKKPAPIPADVEDRIIFKPKASSNNIQANIPVESQQQPAPGPNTTMTVKFEDAGGGETSGEGQQAPRPGHQNATKRADIPEGFFDDPKMDAKARGVDYVDPEEAEWQRFVKEIATEEVQSDNLQVYDEEESRKDRELDEIEDMMIHWQKVIDLEKKKDTRVKKMETKEEESGSSGDEEEFTEELNWRVKKF